MEIITRSPKETQQLGNVLGHLASPSDVILLGGGLGVGKTCLTQGIAQGMNVEGNARSPSFVLIHEYRGKIPLYHADLYRLEHLDEILDLGLEDYLEARGVLVVEWAEKAPQVFPVDHLWVTLTRLDESSRRIVLEPRGTQYQQLLSKLKVILGTTKGALWS